MAFSFNKSGDFTVVVLEGDSSGEKVRTEFKAARSSRSVRLETYSERGGAALSWCGWRDVTRKNMAVKRGRRPRGCLVTKTIWIDKNELREGCHGWMAG